MAMRTKGLSLAASETGEPALTLGQRDTGKSWKTTLFRPMTLIAIALIGLLVFTVVYLERGSVDRVLPVPQVNYYLLPNEGKTQGVPIAIKLNQIAVFMINDPLQEAGGAGRAKEIVATLQTALDQLRAEPGWNITLEEDDPANPSIVLTKATGVGRYVLVTITPEDLTLSGDTEPKRLARVWAERLTDAVKVQMFGEPPKFTIGTAFGDALESVYVKAMGEMGMVSETNLSAAFAELSDAQRAALETLPQLQPEPPAQVENLGK